MRSRRDGVLVGKLNGDTMDPKAEQLVYLMG